MGSQSDIYLSNDYFYACLVCINWLSKVSFERENFEEDWLNLLLGLEYQSDACIRILCRFGLQNLTNYCDNLKEAFF